MKVTLFHQFHRYLAQLINSVRQVNIQHLAALMHSLIVLFKAKEVKLLLFAIPVTPDAFKNCGAIVKKVGHNPQLGFR